MGLVLEQRDYSHGGLLTAAIVFILKETVNLSFRIASPVPGCFRDKKGKKESERFKVNTCFGSSKPGVF